VIFGFKRPSIFVPNLFFCKAVTQAAIVTAIFNNWHWKKESRCSPSSIIVIFYTTGLLSLPQSEIRAGKLLVDPGQHQEELTATVLW
jgi:hypothetical protein